MDDNPTQPLPAQNEPGEPPTAPTEPLAPDADPFGVTAAAASLPPEDAIGAGNPVVSPAPVTDIEPDRASRSWVPWLIIGGVAALLAIALIAFLPSLIESPIATTPTPTPTSTTPTPAATTPPAEPVDGGTDPAPPPPVPPPAPPAPEEPPPPAPEPTTEPTEPAPTPTPTP